MWNMEVKEGQAPAPPPKKTGAPPRPNPLAHTTPVEDDALAKAAADVKKAQDDAEDTAALVETGAALDGLREQLALLEALVARLPE
jgi:hypothetical protein